MKKSELHDILYRQPISQSDKGKLYNFFKKVIDLIDGGGTSLKIKTINNKSLEGEGNITIVEGVSTIKAGFGNFSEIFNYQNTATGIYSHAEGYKTKASGSNSHAEGSNTEASAAGSHAEGLRTITKRIYSHANGFANVEDADAVYQTGIGNVDIFHSTVILRKDAFRITDDGKHYILNIGNFDGTVATASLGSDVKDLATVINDMQASIGDIDTILTTIIGS